jgi:hypothetical protein
VAYSNNTFYVYQVTSFLMTQGPLAYVAAGGGVFLNTTGFGRSVVGSRTAVKGMGGRTLHL